MNVKKKLISSLKKCFILSLCVVIGLAASLQGFCASPTKNYIKYDNVTITSQLFNSSGVSASGVSSCPFTNKDVWSNYFYSVPLFGTTSSGSFSVKIYIKDFSIIYRLIIPIIIILQLVLLAVVLFIICSAVPLMLM